MYIPIQKCIQLYNNKPFKNVVHIGAHYGEECQSYVDSGVETVTWIEAYRNFMPKLFDNTKNLKLKQSYINACLSDVNDEKIMFNISNNGESSSMLEFGTHSTLHPQVSFVDKTEIKTQRFDKLATEHKINVNEIDFINLDVQGAELKVLKGFGDILKLSNIKAIYTEVNFDYVYKDCCLVKEIDDYLGPFGFRRVITSGDPYFEHHWADALYLRNI